MVAHDDVARGRIRRFRQHRARARRSSRGAGRSIASIGGDVRATFYAVSIRARAARAVSSRREIRRARAVPSRRGLTTTRSMMRVCATVGARASTRPAPWSVEARIADSRMSVVGGGALRVVGMLVRTNGSYSVVRDAYLSTTSSTSFVRVHASSSTGGLMKERVNE